MARGLSNAFLGKLFDQAVDEGLVAFLTVDWDDGPNKGTLRLVRWDQDATLDGNTHTAGDFLSPPPDESDVDVVIGAITIADPDRVIRQEIRKLDVRYPASATIDFVPISELPAVALGDVEMSFSGTIRTAKFGMIMLVATFEVFKNLSQEPVTVVNMNVANGFNGLRGAV